MAISYGTLGSAISQPLGSGRGKLPHICLIFRARAVARIWGKYAHMPRADRRPAPQRCRIFANIDKYA